MRVTESMMALSPLSPPNIQGATERASKTYVLWSHARRKRNKPLLNDLSSLTRREETGAYFIVDIYTEKVYNMHIIDFEFLRVLEVLT